jgi:hypothetical protein
LPASSSEFVGAEAQPTQNDEVPDPELLNSAISFLAPKNCLHSQEAELSTPDDLAARTVYDLNVLGAFAVKKYWEDVRERILTLAGGDETVPLSEVLRILDEPVTDIVGMFNNALKAAQGA